MMQFALGFALGYTFKIVRWNYDLPLRAGVE
jgi:hypothetical protein